MIYQDIVRMMLEELKGSCLEVAKIPGREGGYIRVPVSVNAEWYQRFCRSYLRTRPRYPKPRTIIRRQHTERALARLLSGCRKGVYVERLIAFIETHADDLSRQS
jgi:hypothetical protein